MTKKTLLIKDATTTIKFYKSYMTVHALDQNYVIGYRHIAELYVNKCISMTPRDCLRVAKNSKLYFIDQYGYVVASFRIENA